MSTEHGRYLSFYNERIYGITSPEVHELANVSIELYESLVIGITIVSYPFISLQILFNDIVRL